MSQKKGQEPRAKWPDGCWGLLVPDPNGTVAEFIMIQPSVKDRGQAAI